MKESDEKKSTFFERISQIIDYHKIKNVKSFACDCLGYNSSQKINRLKEKNTSPSYEILNDISNKFEDINPEWLLTGKGSMLRQPVSAANEDARVLTEHDDYKAKYYDLIEKYAAILEELHALQKKHAKDPVNVARARTAVG
jgi:DNA integrity scanning protein DisA with diadenylate cyclase activity